MTKQFKTAKPRLITRVSLMDTFRAIEPGTAVKFDCRTAGPCRSAASCACRLNKAAGRTEYRVTTDDNGVTYTVTRTA